MALGRLFHLIAPISYTVSWREVMPPMWAVGRIRWITSCCLPVLRSARAAQSCSRAQHQHGMGKMWGCWMCSNLLPAQGTDIPKLIGNFPIFCSKSKVVCVFSDIKRIVAYLLITKAGKARLPVAWIFSLTLRRNKKCGEDKHFNKLPRIVLEERQALAEMGHRQEAQLNGSHLLLHAEGYNCVPFF